MKKRFLIYIAVLIVDVIIFGGGAYFVFNAKDVISLYRYKYDVREWNKECPRQLNDLFILESVKYEDGALVYKIRSKEGIEGFEKDELIDLFKYSDKEESLPYKELGRKRPDTHIYIEECGWYDENQDRHSVSPKVATYFLKEQIEKETKTLPIKIGDGLTMTRYRLGKENTVITDIDVDESVFDMDVLEVYGKEISEKLKEESSIKKLINNKKFANPHIIYHLVGKNSGRKYDLKIN